MILHNLNETTNQREVKNFKAYFDPLPGDYWHEMCMPYFVVLEVWENSNMIICDEKRNIDSTYWTWDLAKAREVTNDYMKRVCYQQTDGFVADVSREGHHWAVEAWKDLGRPFVTLEEQKKVPVPADFRTVMEQGV
jgi:hypothetical protein